MHAAIDMRSVTGPAGMPDGDPRASRSLYSDARSSSAICCRERRSSAAASNPST
jgi:hypothetical protein